MADETVTPTFVPFTPDELRQIEHAYADYGPGFTVSEMNALDYGMRMVARAQESATRGSNDNGAMKALWQQAARQHADLARVYLELAKGYRQAEVQRKAAAW